MNKAALVAKMAEQMGSTRKMAADALEAFIESVTGALKEGDSVQITGFGTFEVRTRAAHTGRNPATGKAIEIAESKAPVFKVGKTFRTEIE